MYNIYKSYDPSKCESCPLECESNLYSLSVSSVQLPNDYLGFMFNRSVLRTKYPEGWYDATQIKQSILGFNGDYDELKYTNITQLEKQGRCDCRYW